MPIITDGLPHEAILVFYRRNDGSIATIDYDGTDAVERRYAERHLTGRDADRIVWVATRDEVRAADRWTTAVKMAETIALNAARFPQREATPAPEFTINGPTVEVSLPQRFYDDHVSRECNPGRVVRRNKTSVRVLLDGAAWDDLRSDAAYYADDATAAEPELRALASSAAATLRRLDAAGRP